MKINLMSKNGADCSPLQQASGLQPTLLISLLASLLILLATAPTALAQDPHPAGMPKEQGNFRAPDLVELVKLDPSIKLDIRYATANNFLGRQVYPEARAFLQRPAAESLIRVHRAMQKKGYGVLVFDGYRPWAITKVFWDATPASKKNFVANPAKGSKHNRGCAVDMSLFDLKTGKEIPMPSEYDEMTERAYPNYKGGTAEQRKMRDMLRAAMESEGFTVNEYEWWHFDYKSWHEYPILNIGFDQITSQPQPRIRERKPRVSPPSGK